MPTRNDAPMNSFAANRLFWGGLHLPLTCGSQHFCLIGGPGAGKTTLMHAMMRSVLPGLRPGTNRRAVVYDAKRDNFAALLGMGIPEDRILIANPFDRRCAAWNMARDITDPAQAMEIATIFVPQRSHETQPFFPEAARSLLGGVMEAFIHFAPAAQWTFRDVVLTLRSESRMKRVLTQGRHTEHLIELYLSGTDTHRDISATIENTMRRLAFIAAAWDHATVSFSLEQWIHSESILLLGSNPSLESTVQQLNNALLHRIFQLVLDGPEACFQDPPPQTWILIDELRRAGRIAFLPEFAVECRSKGGCLVAAFQDLPGMYEVYGENLAKEILAAARNKAFLKLTDPDTAAYASKHFGQLELDIERVSRNQGNSVTEGDKSSSASWQSGLSQQTVNHARSVVAAREFMRLPDAGPENGISGFFDTAVIGDPYFANLRWASLEDHLVRPHPSAPNVEPRPREHQILREWDEADLARLGLEQFPELLPRPRSGLKGGKSRIQPKPGRAVADESGGLLALLPTRL